MKEQKSESTILPEAENAAPEYRFSLQSEKQRCGNYWFGEDGRIHVKNLSAFWIPELTVTEVIHGTTYVVTGSYEGTENFVRKLERITSRKFAEKLEDSE